MFSGQFFFIVRKLKCYNNFRAGFMVFVVESLNTKILPTNKAIIDIKVDTTGFS